MNSTWMIVAGLLGGMVLGYVLRLVIARRWFQAAKEDAAHVVEAAQREAEQVRKEAKIEAKSMALEARENIEREQKAAQKEVHKSEQRVAAREETIDKRLAAAEQRDAEFKKVEQSVQDQRKHLDRKEQELKEKLDEVHKALERVGGLTVEEAKRELVDGITEDARIEAAKHLRQIDEDTKATAEATAQKIISLSIERMASDHVAERALVNVTLPNEDMKGRIIGREGRNIRAFESITGTEIVIDDSPDTVSVSCFNPIRREVGRRTLQELLKDGRIHPARIEEMTAKMTKQVDQTIKEAGNEAVLELGLHRVHPELVKHMGMLKYRYSYAQNVLHHSVDVGFLCGMMAAELKMNQKQARRAGFLHDIGKALTHEIEGSHALIGMDLCKKYGEHPLVCHAVGAHHEDIPQETALDCLVDAADALSGARPGARREVLETYMKRLEDLENLTKSFKGVEKAFAIQAGREVRVMVKHREVNDAQATLLSKDIARKIEDELTYPGQIKVTVIRETRAVETAK